MNILILITLLMGCSSKVFNKENNEALLLAAREGDVAKINELIAEGVDINYVSSSEELNGATPLMIATLSLHPEAVTVLIEAGANPNYEVSRGFEGGTFQVTPLIILYLIFLDLFNNSINLDSNKVFGTITALIEAGADVNYVTKGGYTVLMLAAATGNLEGVSLLINSGANVNYKGQIVINGVLIQATALMAAEENGHVGVANLLKQNGAK